MHGAPITNPNSRGGVVIRHREYLGDLISSPTAGSFKIQGFPLNPGVAVSFPWLSQVAANFQEYSFEGLVFEFVSTSSDALNSTNTSLGQVIMCTDYNAADALFSDKASMESTEFASSSKPSVNQVHFVECSPRKTAVSTELYVRDSPVPSGQDPRLYDWGTFEIATNGFQGTSVNCGEIWVRYQVALSKPIMATEIASNALYARFNYNATSTYATATPLGTVAPVSVYDQIGITFDLVNQYIIFPKRATTTHYFIYMYWGGAGTTIGLCSRAFPYASNGCTGGSYVFNGAANNLQIPGNATANVGSVSYSLTVRDYPGYTYDAVQITSTGLPTGINNFGMLIMQIPTVG